MNFQVMLLLVCGPQVGKECPSTTEERKRIGSDGERRKRTRKRERTEREKAVTEGRKRRRRGKRHREGGGQRTRAGGTETQREDRGDPSGRGVLRTET